MDSLHSFSNKPLDILKSKPLNPGKPELKIEKNIPAKAQPDKNIKDIDRLFGSRSRERLKGRGSVEEDLFFILKNNPDKRREINSDLRSFGYSPIKSDSTSVKNLVKEMIASGLPEQTLKDGTITAAELESSKMARAEWEKREKIRKKEGYRPFKRAEVLNRHFDLLVKEARKQEEQ